MNPNPSVITNLPFKSEGGQCVNGLHKYSLPNKLLISIITVVYNGEKYLEETIQSVINQTYENVEYIIIDGGSTDGTVDIINKYEGRIDYWVSEKDGGIYDAWNKGINASSGEWIGFLGADDIYLPDAIEKYVSLIMTSPSLEYISAQNILCDDHLNPLQTIGSRWDQKKISKFMNVAHVGSLHHRTLFEQYGLYDTTFKICGDYELLLRAASTLKAEYLDYVTCYMRDGGVSNNNHNAFIETYRAKIIHGRNTFIAKIEMYLAQLKWYIRKKVLH